MNYIKRLESENQELKGKLETVNALLTETMAYLMSAKFLGVENDYVHVRTDILPKLAEIKSEAQG